MISFMQTIGTNLHDWGPRLLQGSIATLLVTLLGFLVAFVLGLGLEFLRTRHSPFARALAEGYIVVARGIPILVVLYLLYFALPAIGIVMSAFAAGALGLGLVYAAYLAEVFRAGLQAVPPGQREAALAAGLSPAQTFRFILFPQAFRIVLPPLLVNTVSMLKDSSVCALISVSEITLVSRAIMSETFLPLHVFALAGAFYFSIAWPASLGVRALERHFATGRRSASASGATPEPVLISDARP